MKKHITKYYILLLLIFIFAAPGIAAYIVYQHPSWLGSSTVNKGTLLNPPTQITSLAKHSKWRIIFWSPESCEASCLNHLDTLARIRLALGRKLYYVEQWLLLGNKVSQLGSATEDLLKEQDFNTSVLSPEDTEQLTAISTKAKIFIANPDNYLILSYPENVNPEDVYKDLKLLLNTAENKSG